MHRIILHCQNLLYIERGADEHNANANEELGANGDRGGVFSN